MNGRWFEARQVEAYIPQGPERFRKSDDKKTLSDDEDGEEGSRLDKFGSWLEKEK
jgi:HIV Tat-specific factor 1